MNTAERLISYTLFADKYATEKIVRADVPWQELVQRIRDAPVYPAKDSCPLISLSEYGDTLSDNGSVRHAQNVLRVHGAEIDYDTGLITLAEAAALLQTANIEAALYTTPSHTPQKPRWRAFLPFSEAALPEKRREYLGRANRILGGIAAEESFNLSRSFFVGRVQGVTYETAETHGRCIDLAAELEPLYSTAHSGNGAARDPTTDAELRAAFDRGEDRYQAMLKLSSRWAAHGMAVDDIESALAAMLGTGSTRNADGIDLRTRIRPMAESAVRKFGETRRQPAENKPAAAAESKAPESLAGRDFADMQAHLADGYVVKGVIGTHSLAAIIGPTSSGKTFFAADLAMHIAAGKSWRGHRVRGGLVIYAALEGPVSAENRFVAAREARKFAPTIPLRLTPGPVNLREAGDQLMLIEFVRAAEQARGKCVAVFIDTLSRAMAGGDENASTDMGALVKGADAVRQATGATVILVHHLGKDETRGARGHSSLKAALDTEIAIEGKDDGLRVGLVQDDPLRVAHVIKQRDLPSGAQFAFRLHIVDLGRDTDGDAVTTCLVEHVEDTPATFADRSPELRSKNQRLLVAALRSRSNADPERIWTLPELRTVGRELGLNKWTATRAVDAIITAGYTQPCVGGHKFTDGVHWVQTGAVQLGAPGE